MWAVAFKMFPNCKERENGTGDSFPLALILNKYPLGLEFKKKFCTVKNLSKKKLNFWEGEKFLKVIIVEKIDSKKWSFYEKKCQ